MYHIPCVPQNPSSHPRYALKLIIIGNVDIKRNQNNLVKGKHAWVTEKPLRIGIRFNYHGSWVITKSGRFWRPIGSSLVIRQGVNLPGSWAGLKIWHLWRQFWSYFCIRSRSYHPGTLVCTEQEYIYKTLELYLCI